jgi:hypothetical protein
MQKVFLPMIAFLLVSSCAWANPISFKGGYGIMPAYNDDWSDLQLNYSLSNHDAVGISSFYREGKNSSSEFAIGQYNYLLKRWNEFNSQANVNLSLGVGGRFDSRMDSAMAGYAALEADYETRRLYSQVSAETLQSESTVRYNRYRGRLGIAPYLAYFEGLQTWFVVQVDYMPEMADATRVTPMGRFFYNNLYGSALDKGDFGAQNNADQ